MEILVNPGKKFEERDVQVMRYMKFALLICPLIIIGNGQLRADLIVNGSFELPNVDGGFGIFPNGAVPGWTSNNNETEIDNSNIAVNMPNYDGPSQNLELNGNIFDTISQTVSGLTIGRQYLLTFAYGNRPGSGFEKAFVDFGGVQVASDSSTTTAPGTWTPHSVIVTATATTEVLSFVPDSTLGQFGNLGNEIDDVTLNAVPEPRAIGLLPLTIILSCLIARRRRARA